jgi:O-antigen/teichoic acid export membrane protein
MTARTSALLPSVRSLTVQAQADPLVRNSFFLMATTALSAASGFVFWLVVARLYPTGEVGLATSLISAVTLLSYFSQLGTGSSLVRHLPTTAERAAHVGSAVATVAVAGVLVAGTFVVILPWAAPQLAFVYSSPGHVLAFVALTVAVALNLLTDSVFVALRAARYNLLVNGVLMSGVKVALPAFFVSLGALGVFFATGIASVVAAVVSILAICTRLEIPVRVRISGRVLRETFRYSLASYASSCLNLAPLMVIPLLVLAQLGPVVAAAYFVAFQLATLVNTVSFAVGESFFAEGSHEQEDLARLTRRAAAVTLAVLVPVVATVVTVARPVLAVFGPDYPAHAYGTLVVLVMSSFGVALNTWTGIWLKITRRLRALTVVNVVYAVVTVSLAVVGAPYGPVWVGMAWGCGNLVAGVVAAIALTRRTGPSSLGKGRPL